jgi:adenylate cyclase
MTLPRIKVPFFVLLILLIAMISAALSVVSYRMANEASNLTASQNTLSMSTETLQSIRRMLASARLVTRLTSHSTLTQQEDLESRLGQLGFIKEALTDSPTISAIFIGYATGDFFLVRVVRDQQHAVALKVHPDTRLVVQSIEHTDIDQSTPGGAAANVHGRFIYFDQDLKLISQNYRPDYAKSYDPRTRGWYKSAAATNGLVTSAPYVFFTDGKLGQTLSIKSPDGRSIIGVDISLDTLNDILQSKRVTPGTHSAIVNDDGFVLALDYAQKQSDTNAPIPKVVNSNAKSTTTSAQQMTSSVPQLKSLREMNIPIFSTVMSIFDQRDSTKPVLANFNVDEIAWRTSTSPLNIEGASPFYLVIASPDHELLANAHEIRRRGIFLAIIISLCSLPIGYLLISRPLKKLTNNIQGLMEFSENSVPIKSSFITELSTLGIAINRLRQTILAFTAYVPRELVRDLVKSGAEIQVGGESRYLTILFTDLKDFSALSEATPSRELLQRISYYLELMTLAIKEEEGTVDKFIGDAVMAFWGAPVLDQHHAYHACHAAIKGQRRMVALNARLVSEKKTPLSVRIGIHTDAVLVGNIGSLERLSYTVMGDGVNIASRLEGINKTYGTHICVSHAVYKEAGERLWLRPIDKIRVKGRESEFLIYELLGTRDGSSETQATETEQALCELTEQAYALYAAKQYREALTAYQDIAERFDDTLSKVMLEQCQTKMTIEV